MVTETVLEERGRLTIPAEVRREMGWHPGTKLRLIATTDGDLIVDAYPAKRKPLRSA